MAEKTKSNTDGRGAAIPLKSAIGISCAAFVFKFVGFVNERVFLDAIKDCFVGQFAGVLQTGTAWRSCTPSLALLWAWRAGPQSRQQPWALPGATSISPAFSGVWEDGWRLAEAYFRGRGISLKDIPSSLPSSPFTSFFAGFRVNGQGQTQFHRLGIMYGRLESNSFPKQV